MPGEVNGVAGRFEWIRDGDKLTYQFFVRGGKRLVTIHVVGEGVGVQGFPVTAVWIASKALMPCLRAVET